MIVLLCLGIVSFRLCTFNSHCIELFKLKLFEIRNSSAQYFIRGEDGQVLSNGYNSLLSVKSTLKVVTYYIFMFYAVGLVLIV